MRRFGCESLQLALIALKISPDFDEVARGVAADRQFGEDYEIRAAGRRLLGGGDHPIRIPGEVAHGGVDLAEGELHGFCAMREAVPLPSHSSS